MKNTDDVKENLLDPKEKLGNYGTFNNDGQKKIYTLEGQLSRLELIPDDLWKLIYIYLNTPSTSTFKTICQKLNTIATKFDEQLQKNPALLLNHLSWEEIAERIKKLDRLLLKKTSQINNLSSELEKYINSIEENLKEINIKMGDERDAPIHALNREIITIQRNYGIQLSSRTNQSIRSTSFREKLAFAGIAALALLGVFFIMLGIKKQDNFLKFYGGLLLVAAFGFLGMVKCGHICEKPPSPQAESEIRQALKNEFIKTEVLTKKLEPTTLTNAKKILSNRSVFFAALKSTEDFAEKLPKQLPPDVKALMKNIYNVMNKSDLLDSPTIKAMFDFYLSADPKEERVEEIKDEEDESEETSLIDKHAQTEF